MGGLSKKGKCGQKDRRKEDVRRGGRNEKVRGLEGENPRQGKRPRLRNQTYGGITQVKRGPEKERTLLGKK